MHGSIIHCALTSFLDRYQEFVCQHCRVSVTYWYSIYFSKKIYCISWGSSLGHTICLSVYQLPIPCPPLSFGRLSGDDEKEKENKHKANKTIFQNVPESKTFLCIACYTPTRKRRYLTISGPVVLWCDGSTFWTLFFNFSWPFRSNATLLIIDPIFESLPLDWLLYYTSYNSNDDHNFINIDRYII